MVIGTHVPGNGVYSQPEAPKARRGGRVASGPHPKCEQQDCVRPARRLKGGLCEPCRAADYYRRKSPHAVRGRALRVQECVDCSEPVSPNHLRCTSCAKVASQIGRSDERRRSCKVYFPTCATCGVCFTAKLSVTLRCKTCAPVWRAERSRRIMRKRRQGMVIVDKVEVRVLFDRDRGVCQLCRKRVKLGLKYPNPGMASIDHIIPVSDGGEHSYRNTQLAHLGCNLAKCTKAVGEQLRLVG